jgi:hypothetical protein
MIPQTARSMKVYPESVKQTTRQNSYTSRRENPIDHNDINLEREDPPEYSTPEEYLQFENKQP